MDSAYFSHPRQFAALDDEIVGTAAARADGPKSPPHAPWLAVRYPSTTTAEPTRTTTRRSTTKLLSPSLDHLLLEHSGVVNYRRPRGATSPAGSWPQTRRAGFRELTTGLLTSGDVNTLVTAAERSSSVAGERCGTCRVVRR